MKLKQSISVKRVVIQGH